ncbi:pilus assembly FimT family protein [Vampirovibrio chlorellavorus]|uniref:pilus assembly FimT family protein n=1 Tax=Vampirovibrio chlorellavorus TaxID=758823 RepID=UPI0026ED7DA4|nr:type II secretion system protein [Vampirovibrio chlorellavorus]
MRCSPPMLPSTALGFTLAELLVSLAILGVIATFAIPKLVSTQQAATNKARAKEVAAMITGAYQKAQQDGIVTSNTKSSDLIPYINYVAQITDGRLIDSIRGFTSRTCDAANPCVSLHGGGILWFQNTYWFGGSSTLNVIEFDFDPDGTYSGSSADSPGKSVQFTLYYNGLLTTRGQPKPNSCDNTGCTINPGNFDPSWFNWN